MTAANDPSTGDAYDLPDLDDLLNEPAGPPNAQEIMRIWRDETDGTLIIQIDDQYHRTRGDVKAAGQERLFMGVLRELATIAKETAGIVTQQPAEPAPAETGLESIQAETEQLPDEMETPVPVEQDSVGTGLKPIQPVQTEAASVATLPPGDMTFAQQTAPEESEEIGTFFGNFRNAFRRKPKSAAPVPIKSIPEQIEDLLQQHLQDSGAFPGRIIHLREAVNGGILIEVDGTAYEGVGEIAEPDVREFVQATIRQWEQQQQG